MRKASLTAVRAGLLGAPAVLAFFSGGYFPEPRLWALVAAWALAAAAALAVPAPALPRSAGARLALAALAGYAAWVWLATTWSPAPPAADQTAELAALYTGTLLAGALVWRDRAPARAAEPALLAGALTVSLYGLSGRLLPSIVHLHASARAGGRLEQPLTYWNAQGALAALGAVLATRLAGDATRSRGLRLAAAAAVAPLGAAVYLSFSRGAVAAGVVGVLAVAGLARDRTQARAAGLAAATAAAGALAVAPFGAVRALEPGDRAAQGAAALVLLLVVAAAAAAVHARAHRVADARPLPRRALAAVAGLAIIAALLPIAIAIADRGSTAQPRFGATTARLSDIGTHRGAYWRVALQVAADHPLAGAGSGAFGIEWSRRRTIDEHVVDAHSLYLESLAELGVVGLALLLAAIAGVVVAARDVLRRDRALAAGPAAAALAWAVHAGLDWDWEMPALTLVAVVLASVLLARGDAAGT